MSGEGASSFRDPTGRVFARGDRVIRVVDPGAGAAFTHMVRSAGVRELVESGEIVTTRLLEGEERAAAVRELGRDDGGLIAEHPAIPFPTYPHEWTAGMLCAAATLTLDVAERLLPHGLGLKDATPYNVLFRWQRPVLVDVASIEQRRPSDETWLPYAQFVRTFLLPLLAHRQFGIPLSQVFLASREGLPPEAVYEMAGRLRRCLPPFLGLVSLPTWLGAGRRAQAARLYERPAEVDPERARYVLTKIFRWLRGQLSAVSPALRASAWSHYPEKSTYEAEDQEQKKSFVASVMSAGRAQYVLDLGCNTGVFSELAARQGAAVVALDSDGGAAARAVERARGTGLTILVVLADIARPTPALGWRNSEEPSLLSRLGGRFDLVLMLAVIHHLLVTERVPLAEIVELAAELSRSDVVAEYVPPTDPMFRTIARGRDHLHAHMSSAWFEDAWRTRFEAVRSVPLANGRRLYLFRRAAL